MILALRHWIAKAREPEREQVLRRCSELVSGFIVWNVTDYAFDYVLYPIVIWRYGAVVGGTIMALLSLFVCLMLLRLYDYLKRDWLGIEFVKSLRKYDGDKTSLRVVAYLLSRSDMIAFLILSAKYDPFITTAYLRGGQYAGMKSVDWGIFLSSWLLSNVLWIIICSEGIQILENLFLAVQAS